MYNIDKKGFLISFLAKSKRIFTRVVVTLKQLLGVV